MKLLPKLLLLLFILVSSFLYGQTPGINYQALILNNTVIEIPGTDVAQGQIPLGLEEVRLRFSISNETVVEYSEEQSITTDENGMISLIVGEGTPVLATFEDIVWDGTLKYLNVEINILSNNDGFVFLDTQKILYVPHPSNGTSQVVIVNSLSDLTPPYATGDLIWMENYGASQLTTLLIYNGTAWVPVSEDYDPTNELALIVVADDAERDAAFNPANVGDQVWNQACGCIEVFDGTNWISISSITATNGVKIENDQIKLGGALTEATSIATSATNTLAITNLEESTDPDDQVVMVTPTTGVLKRRSISDILQQEQVVVTAIEGQLQFTTPAPVTSINKLDVYRNGARISFVLINPTTIEIEPEAICFQGDKIRIVQLSN